jgi:transposase
MTELTGPERRRGWSAAERSAIFSASFAPGAVVIEVAWQFDISTSLLHRRRQDPKAGNSFAPGVLSHPPAQAPAETMPIAIVVELGDVRVNFAGLASAPLVAATLRALR